MNNNSFKQCYRYELTFWVIAATADEKKNNEFYKDTENNVNIFAVCIYRYVINKVRMYEEIMTNDDNLESSLPTSSLL